MQEPKIIIESLETWTGGKATGYYQPFKNEIHVLRGKDLEHRALYHEKVHANRRDKRTAKFAQVFAVPIIPQLYFGLLMVLAVVGVFTSIIPFLVTAGMFLFFIVCHVYEEYIADSLTARNSNEIRKLGETVLE
jgi:fatty acid desaturase